MKTYWTCPECSKDEFDCNCRWEDMSPYARWARSMARIGVSYLAKGRYFEVFLYEADDKETLTDYAIKSLCWRYRGKRKV